MDAETKAWLTQAAQGSDIDPDCLGVLARNLLGADASIGVAEHYVAESTARLQILRRELNKVLDRG